jgi:D-sedoheptulose 7-phosphate isomerase
MNFIQCYLDDVRKIVDRIDTDAIEAAIALLADVKRTEGRLFFIGVGGSAANCSHAVNDFRKLAGIEAYSPTDNVAELTARTNDSGWRSVFVDWLKVSRLSSKDAVFVMSVGGGDVNLDVSVNIVEALKLAKRVGARVLGIVGRDGGYTAQVADVCLLIPTVIASAVTPHTEAFQAILWHLLVFHPALREHEPKWGAHNVAANHLSTRAVFLDRDGVINEAIVREGRPYAPRCLNEVRIPAAVPDALSSLRDAGFRVVVVTNQPDVARGLMSVNEVEEINSYLLRTLAIDEIKTCVHDTNDACACRKPAPGALLAAAQEHGISLKQSYLVGDRWSDMEAGLRAGCTVIFIDHGYDEHQPRHVDYRVGSFAEAVHIILEQENRTGALGQPKELSRHESGETAARPR